MIVILSLASLLPARAAGGPSIASASRPAAPIIASSSRPAPPTITPTSRPATSQSAADDEFDPIIPLVDFRATPLAKAFDALRDQTHVNIVVRWAALKEAGLTPASIVDLRVRNLALQRVLELMGESAEAGTWQTRLAAWAERGVVIVSTRDQLENETVLRFYDVRDLIEADMTTRKAWKPASMPATTSATTPATAPPTAPPTVPPVEPPAEPTQFERFGESMDLLKQLIQDSIDPESWRENGGSVGSIRDFNGRLVIGQTPAVQERIAKLLAELRRT